MQIAISSRYTGLFLAFVVVAQVPCSATPASGTTQTTPAARAPISSRIEAHQWGSGPLFNLLVESSTDNVGFDIVNVIAEFAPVSATGKPSTSGWHSHPVGVAFIQIVQGILSVQEKDDPGCVREYRAGSVFVETKGHIHNAFNLDATIPAVARIVYILPRDQTAATVSEPDPLTGDPNLASPPPAAMCAVPEPQSLKTVNR
jgi:hypothetical protein